MFPILIQFNGFAIHTYGVFVALGVLSGIFLARYEARRLGLDADRVLDLCFYIIVAAIVGSRLFYVATHLDYFMARPLEIFMIWNGGLVFYGGFIGAALVVLIYLWVYRLPLGKTSDIAGLSLPLGHFLGRIGCFFAGCCYGQACELPWAITFTHAKSLAPLNVALHPTQLYHSFSNLFIFLVLFSLRRRKRFDGQIFWLYILFYGVARSVIEFFRGDFRGATVFDMFSISQGIGISSAVVAIVMLIILSRRTQSLDKNG